MEGQPLGTFQRLPRVKVLGPKIFESGLRTDKKDYAQALDKRGRMDVHIAAFDPQGKPQMRALDGKTISMPK